MSRVCACKRGYASEYDGKCGHCRTRREREIHRRPVEAAVSPFQDETNG